MLASIEAEQPECFLNNSVTTENTPVNGGAFDLSALGLLEGRPV